MLATDQKEDEGGKLGNFGAEWEDLVRPGLRPAWGPGEGGGRRTSACGNFDTGIISDSSTSSSSTATATRDREHNFRFPRPVSAHIWRKIALM